MLLHCLYKNYSSSISIYCDIYSINSEYYCIKFQIIFYSLMIQNHLNLNSLVCNSRLNELFSNISTQTEVLETDRGCLLYDFKLMLLRVPLKITMIDEDTIHNLVLTDFICLVLIEFHFCWYFLKKVKFLVHSILQEVL